MKNLFYNIEKRVETFDELLNTKGTAGKRVLVLDTGIFYYWKDETWNAEGSGINYSYYNCQLFQSGTNTLYDNVLGNHTFSSYITWERLDVGIYRGTLEGGFVPYRTQFLHSGINRKIAGGFSSPPASASFNYVSFELVDNDTVLVYVTDSATLEPADGLSFFDLEIRVYNDNTLRD
jgi:hypothetical protein